MKLLLKALACENDEGRPPVWLMRQAGRYLPSYQEFRKKNSLWSLFHDPQLASDITFLPHTDLGVDGLILFSDILVVAEMFGKKVVFPDGGSPQIEPQLTCSADVDALQIIDPKESLPYVKQTIENIIARKKQENIETPLIGFCGGPFTIASYMIDRSGSTGLPKTKEWIRSDPASFHRLLAKITEASILYLKMQIESGVEAIQVFDSWAGMLPYRHFLRFSLTYLNQIVSSLKQTNVPVILFCRGSSLFPRELSGISPSAISFDWQRDLHEIRRAVPEHIAVQGNLDPTFLKEATPSQVRAATEKLLQTMRGDRGFIANLGHGVLPETPVENVRTFIHTIQNFS